MINTKYNRKSDKAYAADMWRCDQCKSEDTQSHILWCPVFAPLREGKSLAIENGFPATIQKFS